MIAEEKALPITCAALLFRIVVKTCFQPFVESTSTLGLYCTPNVWRGSGSALLRVCTYEVLAKLLAKESNALGINTPFTWASYCRVYERDVLVVRDIAPLSIITYEIYSPENAGSRMLEPRAS